MRYGLIVSDDFDLRFIATLHAVAEDKLPGINVDRTTLFSWPWRVRFRKFLHPDVVHIAVSEELVRWQSGQPGYFVPNREEAREAEQDNKGYIYLSG